MIFNKSAALSFMLFWISLEASLCQESNYYLGPAQYSFIKYDQDILNYSPANRQFNEFFRGLDTIMKTGEGKLQIVHLGGSHIQADIYTHQIRKRFQGLTPDMNGGRGLIFPLKIAKTNSPSNFSVAYNGTWTYCKSTQNERICKLGLTGVAVTTSDSAVRLTINPNKEKNISYAFNSVRIFHEASQYTLGIKIADSLFIGKFDSLGGFTKIDLPSYERYLDLRVFRDTLPGEFILQGISLDTDASGVVYNAIGVNGSMLKSFLGSERYVQHLNAIEPNMVIFSIGTNDAYTRRFDAEGYRSRFGRLIDSTRKAAPDAAILLTVPNDSYLYKKYVNRNTEKMQKIILELAIEYDCGVWDFYTIMGGLNSSQAWYSVHLMNYDRIHFNRNGYLLKGELLFSAFLKAWENRSVYAPHISIPQTNAFSEPVNY